MMRRQKKVNVKQNEKEIVYKEIRKQNCRKNMWLELDIIRR